MNARARRRSLVRLLAALALAGLAACADEASNTPAAAAPAPEFAAIDWLDLIPPEELENYRLGVAFATSRIDHLVEQRPSQFGSFATVAALEGRKISLQGYVVPLDTDEQGLMTSYFFVPTLGACIHVPPPPPDQMIYVNLSMPATAPEYGEARWLKGTLHTQTHNLELASAAYAMQDPVLSP
jgi:hypothetical protein